MKQTYHDHDQDHLSKAHQLLAASALIPVVGALSMPTSLQGLIYSIFVGAYLAPTVFKKRKKKNPNLKEGEIESVLPEPEESSSKTGPPLKTGPATTFNFFMVLIGCGLISECLAWVSELYALSPNPALLHPQLLPDLFLGLFYYLGLATAWLILIKKFQFALREIFFLSFIAALLTQAKLGTLNTLCESLVIDPVAGVLTVASLLVVGGSITALAFLAGHKDFPQEKKPDLTKVLIKYAVSLILIVVLPEFLASAAGQMGKPFGLCPDKKPIKEAPLI